MMAVALCTFSACKKKDDGPKAWTPGPVTGYHVTPINGGATVTYDIPKDPDIQYIMAEYIRNGQVFTEKSSVYKNSLTIQGFNTVGNVKVTLYKVNKLGQKSEPFEFEFKPLRSLIGIAKDSLQIETTFGGITASWVNPGGTELGVRMMIKNENSNVLETKEMYFSSLKHDVRSFRGFEHKEYTFAISFEDKWGNVSDTTIVTTTPFFETMVPKPYGDMTASIPYDNTSHRESWITFEFALLSDGIVNTEYHGFLTAPGNSGLSITFDLKQVVKLSRIVIHPYSVDDAYNDIGFFQWEAWGVKKLDFAKLADRPYWLDETSVRDGSIWIDGINNTTVLPAHTFKDDWQYLGWHIIPRYDQLVPPDNIAISNMAANGASYDIPLDAKPVRYVRIFVRATGGGFPPSNTNYFGAGEITFYGDNTVPQE